MRYIPITISIEAQKREIVDDSALKFKTYTIPLESSTKKNYEILIKKEQIKVSHYVQHAAICRVMYPQQRNAILEEIKGENKLNCVGMHASNTTWQLNAPPSSFSAAALHMLCMNNRLQLST